jgi:hypothetical protein
MSSTRHARRRAAVAILAAVLVCVVGAGRAAADLPPVPDNPIGAHSMLYAADPRGAKEAMFREARAAGASFIRVDIALLNVFPRSADDPHWGGVDEYMELSRAYGIRVLADILGPPACAARCPPGTPSSATLRCPADPAAWGAMVGALAAHTRGVIDHFEVINEPDAEWAYLGTPEQYAAQLAASTPAIRAADPAGVVVLGGIMDIGPGGDAWFARVRGALGPAAMRTFDVANIHVRGPASSVARAVAHWRFQFAASGFRGPLWVTEAGYPADPAYQDDPAYRDGEAGQARYLAAAVPRMVHAGAARVFVSERDSLKGAYASEGFLATKDPLGPQPVVRRRPAFAALRALAAHFPPAPPPPAPPLPPAAPSALAAPAVHGVPRVGETLRTSSGRWLRAHHVVLRWQRKVGGRFRDIRGATRPTYRPSAADAGRRLAVVAAAFGPGGGALSSSARTRPVDRSSARVALSVAAPDRRHRVLRGRVRVRSGRARGRIVLRIDRDLPARRGWTTTRSTLTLHGPGGRFALRRALPHGRFRARVAFIPADRGVRGDTTGWVRFAVGARGQAAAAPSPF